MGLWTQIFISWPDLRDASFAEQKQAALEDAHAASSSGALSMEESVAKLKEIEEGWVELGLL